MTAENLLMLKYTLQPILALAIGAIIFLLDYYEEVSPGVNEVVLFLLCISKSAYFIYVTFSRIKKTLETEFFYHEFLSFIIYNVLLIILSYAIDYYCLYRIDETAFRGTANAGTIVSQFITFSYFSIATFTTVGFGDIFPVSTSARIFVSTEVLLAFFFNILIIANVVHLRESLGKKQEINKPR